MVKTVIIGAGAMGLAAAHYALKAGHEVDVVEADATAGGMAAHFDFDGLSLERFYHFVCKADATTFALMKELGIADKMRWRAHLDGLLARRTDLSLGRSDLAAALPQARSRQQIPHRPANVPDDEAQEFRLISRNVSTRAMDRERFGAPRVRSSVAPAARAEILRICRQCLRRLDRDAHQAGRHVAQIDVPGRARLYRRRFGNAGFGARRLDRKAGRPHPSGDAGAEDRRATRPRDRRRRRAAASFPPTR